MRRIARTHFLWAIVVALSVLLGTGMAWAHPEILSIDPPPGAQLATPPSQLRITFNAPLEAISGLALHDSHGREVPPAEPAAAPDPLPLAAILLRGIMLIGAATGTGGLAFLIWILGPALAQAGGDPATLRRGQVWLAAPLLICAAAAPLMLVSQTYTALGTLDLVVLTHVATMRYGQVLLVRAGLALALAVAAVSLRREQYLRHGVCLTLSAWLLLNFALGGHAATDSAPTLSILADAIHLGATALWVGGLLAFATLLPSAMRSVPEDRRPDLLRALFAQFTALAVASVALLTVTGTYAALRRMSALSDLWTTHYGLALLAKLIAFGAMLLFGLYHMLVARPGLNAWATHAAQARPWPRLLGRTLRLDAALGLIAILAAGALTSLAPPRDSRAAPSDSRAAPTTIRMPTVTPGPPRTPVPSPTHVAADLRVRLETRPPSVGDDRFRVTVRRTGTRD
ncbi:MAG: CopD family protein [Chloroflexales bacterium]